MSTRAAGPVALLLQSLGTAGLTIDIAGNVGGAHGSISIAHSPRHLCRSVINESALKGTITALHKRRPKLAPEQNIDWDLTRPLWKHATAEGNDAASQRHLLALAAGGAIGGSPTLRRLTPRSGTRACYAGKEGTITSTCGHAPPWSTSMPNINGLHAVRITCRYSFVGMA